MRKINWLIVFLIVSSYANAQQDSSAAKKKMMDSVRAVYIDEAALKYPRIRQFSISHEAAGAGDIRSELYGKDFFKGRLRTSTTTINLNVPVIESGKNTVVAGFGVIQQHFSLDEVTSYNVQYAVPKENRDLTTFRTSINYIRRDTLLGLPITFNVGVTGLFNSSFSRQRLTYTGLISLPLLRTKNSSLTAGLIVNIDPSSPVPAFPFLSYSHRFQSLRMDLMVDMPSRIAVRKELNKKASLSVFGDLAGSNSFLDINNATLPQQNIYSSLSIKSGLLFEYRFTKKAVFSFSGGLQSTLTSKVVEHNETQSNYFIKNNNDMVPYLQVGVSLLPFWKPFR